MEVKDSELLLFLNFSLGLGIRVWNPETEQVVLIGIIEKEATLIGFKNPTEKTHFKIRLKMQSLNFEIIKTDSEKLNPVNEKQVFCDLRFIQRH